jgi:hypothetical protein
MATKLGPPARIIKFGIFRKSLETLEGSSSTGWAVDAEFSELFGEFVGHNTWKSFAKAAATSRKRTPARVHSTTAARRIRRSSC